MKRTMEDIVINRMCPDYRSTRPTTTKQSTYWLTVDGLQKVRAHVALSGLDIIGDVAKALVKQYGRTEATDMVSRLYDESKLHPEIRHYIEFLIAAI